MELSKKLGDALMVLDTISNGEGGWIRTSLLDLANKLGLAIDNQITEAGKAALKVYLEHPGPTLKS